MAQVSFPGVYIQEVPSGARTITGVATSIAAFVGMAKQGPVNVPTTVLGFTDFARTFSEDVSNGEMPDQVRQFFLNGGTQAIIMRIANGALKSSLTLSSAGTAVGVLTLTAINDGQGGDALRVAVDYDTASPEATFNLTIYSESFDARGNSTLTLLETFTNLSFDGNDARFVSKIVNENSAFVTAAFLLGPTDIPPAGAQGATFSGTLFNAQAAAGANPATNYGNLITTVVNAKGGTGNFRLRVADQAATVTLTTTPGVNLALADVQTAVNTAFLGKSTNGQPIALTVSFGLNAVGTQILSITSAMTPGVDVRADTASTFDIAQDLGLGVAQGGVEISVLAPLRPSASGLVSTVADDLTNILAFADVAKSTWLTPAAGVSLALVGSAGFSVNPATVAFANATPTSTMKEGTAVAGNPAALSLRNVRQNMQAIADAINLATTQWRAGVQGTRLALTPKFGDALAGPGNQWAATVPPGILSTATTPALFAALPAGATQPRTARLSGGDDGQAPKITDYENAYTIIDSQVDLFNLLILPKNAADTGNDRSALWGPASVFCEQRRAFLLIDPQTSIDTVDKAVQEIKTLRIGTVTDHSAAYWPRVNVNPDGSPRFIDASGSIAGIMSRIDGSRGVWKAPAGLEADVRGILGVAVKMSDPENGRINPEALNAIRVFPNGIVSWGARTMAGFDNSGNDDFKYVPVRRVELFIEESLVRGLRFAVFEPNDEPLWAQLRLAVGGFMNNLFRQGAFQGATATQAYFVKVDSETTTQNDINLGIVNVVVGFAPLKPAEFVVITIKQLAGQIQV